MAAAGVPAAAVSVRVLVVDDDEMVRSGLAAILDGEPDLEVVGEASDGEAAVRAALTLRPEVVVMDVRMPVVDGIEATRRLVRAGGPRVLVLTTFVHDGAVHEALRAGAHGFLLKRAGAARLVHAVRTLATTDAVLYPEEIRDLVLASAARRPALPELTAREGAVLRLLAAGLSNREIAGRLHLGTETVKTHVSALLAKLGVRDRTQAVVLAFESGFVRPGEDQGCR